MLQLMRKAIGTDELQFEDITVANIRKVKQYLVSEKSNGTAVTYMAIIKATIRQLEEDGLIQHRNYGQDIRVKKVDAENVVLTEEEFGRIVSYYHELQKKKGHQPEKDVLTLFLVESLTGARQGDAELLTSDNIRDGHLAYVSQKTKRKAVMPAHTMLAGLLENMPEKRYSTATKDRTIKRVARKCGIDDVVAIRYRGKFQSIPKWKCIGTHSARRFLATTLDSHGTPIAEISRFMGHKSAEMTMKYIVPSVCKASEAAMSFFNG